MNTKGSCFHLEPRQKDFLRKLSHVLETSESHYVSSSQALRRLINAAEKYPEWVRSALIEKEAKQ